MNDVKQHLALTPPQEALQAFFVDDASELATATPTQKALVTTPALGDALDVLVFRLGDQSFALPVTRIQEAIRRPMLTFVPRTQHATLGVANVRGNMVPVVDLAQVLGLLPVKPLRLGQVLFLRDEAAPLGLAIDHVRHVLRLAPAALKQVPLGLGLMHQELILGLSTSEDDTTLVVLDADALSERLSQVP